MCVFVNLNHTAVLEVKSDLFLERDVNICWCIKKKNSFLFAGGVAANSDGVFLEIIISKVKTVILTKMRYILTQRGTKCAAHAVVSLVYVSSSHTNQTFGVLSRDNKQIRLLKILTVVLATSQEEREMRNEDKLTLKPSSGYKGGIWSKWQHYKHWDNLRLEKKIRKNTSTPVKIYRSPYRSAAAGVFLLTVDLNKLKKIYQRSAE